MKLFLHKILIVVVVISPVVLVDAQVSVSTTGSVPDSSAMLDIQSTDKGVLIPRMTAAQRNSIPNPATGLLVYDTNENRFKYYEDAGWLTLSTLSASDTIWALSSNGKSIYANITDDALGYQTNTANGEYSFAAGVENDVNGDFSAAFGLSNNLDGNNSFAAGFNNNVSGYSSMAFGNNNSAIGGSSFAVGFNAITNGFASVALGEETWAIAEASVALGFSTWSKSFGETTVGMFSEDYTASSTNNWSAYDRVFTVGNGSDFSHLSNALTILKNGNSGFGTSTPDTTFHLVGKMKYQDGTQTNGYVLTSDADGNATWAAASGTTLDDAYDFGGPGMGRIINATDGAVRINGTDGFLVTGNFNNGDVIEMSGGGIRMFFNPRKAAFRAGSVDGSQWDNTNIGDYSIAMGPSPMATAWSSLAIGAVAKATESNAVAIGDHVIASGSGSTAMGTYTMARSHGEIAVGLYNTDYTPANTTGFNASDRVFSVGNGSSGTNRSNAITILKNGNTGLGIDVPEATIHVVGSLKYQDGSQADGLVLTSDVDGNANWSAPAGDNLGDHSASQTINTNGNWISGDGGNEGLKINNNGLAGINTSPQSSSELTVGSDDTPTLRLYQDGTGSFPAYYWEILGNETNFAIRNNAGTGVFGFLDNGNIWTNNNWLSGDGDAEGIQIGDNGQVKFSHIINTNNHWLSGDGGSEGIHIEDNGRVNAQSNISGFEGFAMKITNTANSNADRDDGLLIVAGHGSYNSGNESSFIQFNAPDGDYCGRIRQTGNNSVDYVSASDQRLKENIRPTSYGLNNLMKIDVVDYNYKTDSPSDMQTGFLAQQLYSVFPQSVDVGGEDPKTQPWGVDYGAMTPLLVRAVQEQQELIDSLKKENKELKAALEIERSTTDSRLQKIEEQLDIEAEAQNQK